MVDEWLEWEAHPKNVPCWMPKSLPPRNECTGYFAPTKMGREILYNQDDRFAHSRSPSPPRFPLLLDEFVFIHTQIQWMSGLNGKLTLRNGGLGEPTHTFAPFWMPKSLPPRYECTGCFALAEMGRVLLYNQDDRFAHLGSPSKFEKMRVCSWHIRAIPHHNPSPFGRVCLYSH